MLAVLGPRSGCGTVLWSDRQTGYRHSIKNRGSLQELSTMSRLRV